MGAVNGLKDVTVSTRVTSDWRRLQAPRRVQVSLLPANPCLLHQTDAPDPSPNLVVLQAAVPSQDGINADSQSKRRAGMTGIIVQAALLCSTR